MQTFRRKKGNRAFRTIPLTQGQSTIVSAEDYLRLNKHKWCAAEYPTGSGHFYAYRVGFVRGKRITISMAREVLHLKSGDPRQADHIFHNTLDNRRCKLRICTSAQNGQNRLPKKDGSSSFKGVIWYKGRLYKGKRYKGKWSALVVCEGKRIFLGLFADEIDAAKAYDRKAKELYGEFAYLNFPNIPREEGDK